MQTKPKFYLSLSEKRDLGDLLARNLHRFSPFQIYEAKIGTKTRVLHRTEQRDQWVLEALALLLRERSETFISSCVYSYARGRGPIRALSEVRRRLRDTEPKQKTYIIRRDIKEYTDSIPVGEHSPLWKMLENIFPEDLLFKNLKNALRPEVRFDEGAQARTQTAGVPMGSPLTPWIANLYLKPLDVWASGLHSEDLYIRYGDDILFVSASRERARRILMGIDDVLTQLGLSSNREKEKNIVLSRNGHADSDDVTNGFSGRPDFEYLGRRILASGQMGITSEKRSLLLREARYRVKAVLRSHGIEERKQKISELTDSVGRALFLSLDEVWSSHWRGSSRFSSLVSEITHPGDWRSLRLDLLRETLKVLTGSTSFYHLRGTTWKKLIHHFGWNPIGLKKVVKR